jgi:hypothetical protein
MSELPPFFLRRFNGQKFEKIMKRAAVQAFFVTTNREGFKRELISSSIDTFFYTLHKIDVNELDKKEMDKMIEYVLSIFESLIDMYYNNLRRDYPLHHKK